MAPINLALNKIVAASSYVMPYGPSKVVNGSVAPLSRWLCNSLPGWVSVDLGAHYWINRWVVRHMSVVERWSPPGYSICNYQFQISNNNTNWIAVDFLTNNGAAITDRTIPAVQCRYVRVYVTKGLNINPKLASFMELEIYPAPASSLLTSLTLSSGTLNPVFASSTFNYSSSVSYSTSSITVTPTAQDSSAVIKVNESVVKSGTVSSPIALSVGPNNISIQVTAADGSSQNTYSINVTRAKSSNADLSNLTISSGILTPNFASGTLNYTTTVGGNVGSINVTPTAADAGATITVNGASVQSGQPTTVNLTGTTTNISIVVTAQDGETKKTYTLNVTKQQNSSYLTNLVANVSGKNVVSGFTKTTTSYNANVGYDDSSIIVIPTVEDSTSTAVININGATVLSGQSTGLNVGTNTITVTVTAATGNNTVYTLTVVRATALTGINAIVVGGATIPLTPSTFDKTQLSYSGTIEYSNSNFTTQDVEITPIAAAGVVIKYNGNVISSGTPVKVTPSVGANAVNFVVSALDGTGQVTYTVTINRNHSTYLKGITCSPGIVSPAITKGPSFNYAVKAGAMKTSTTVTLTAEDPSADITLKIDSSVYTSTNGVVVAQNVSVVPKKTGTATVTSNSGIPSNVYTIVISK